MDFAVPMIQVELSQGGTLEVGADHTFKCSSSGADKLNPSTTYQWTQNNGTHTSQVGNNSNGLSLVSLRLSDAGEYACTITVNSPYLNENISKNITKSLIIISKLIIFVYLYYSKQAHTMHLHS